MFPQERTGPMSLARIFEDQDGENSTGSALFATSFFWGGGKQRLKNIQREREWKGEGVERRGSGKEREWKGEGVGEAKRLMPHPFAGGRVTSPFNRAAFWQKASADRCAGVRPSEPCWRPPLLPRRPMRGRLGQSFGCDGKRVGSSATFPILSRDPSRKPPETQVENGSGFRKERWLERMDKESSLRLGPVFHGPQVVSCTTRCTRRSKSCSPKFWGPLYLLVASPAIRFLSLLAF